MRRENDRMREEILFQQRNAVQLDRAKNVQAACRLPVASVKLGFETVRSRLQVLSGNLGFNGVRIDGQMEQATENRVPFQLKMQGTLEKIRVWMAALKALPYLTIKSCRVVVAYPKSDASIEMELDFQFEIDPAGEFEIRSLQAAAHPQGQEAVAR